MAKPAQMTLSHHGGTLGFEAELWAAANALRGSMGTAEYKYVVLGTIFLKYISACATGASGSRQRRQGPPRAGRDGAV